MKICLIAPLFKPWSIGGAEIYAEILTRELSQDNNVVVITSQGPQKRNSENQEKNLRVVEFNPKNIFTYYDFVTSQKINFFRNFLWRIIDLWNFSSYQAIKKILVQEKPDIVHTNGIRGFSPMVFKAIKTLKIPHVHVLHDHSLISQWASLFRNGHPISKLNIFDKMYILYLRRISSSAHSVISPSKYLMDAHTRLGYFKNSEKVIIPTGCDLECKEKPKEKNNKKFLFIGQLLEGKGILTAIKAFQKIHDKEVEFHIIGRGPFEMRIKKEIKNNPGIILHGYVPHEKINSFLEECSFLVVPSIWPEPAALVINEGMRRALPVIASNIGGIPEFVQQNYNGFLFKAGDVNSLYTILNDAINEKYDYFNLSSNALKSSKNLSIEHQIQSTIEVYKKTLSTI